MKNSTLGSEWAQWWYLCGRVHAWFVLARGVRVLTSMLTSVSACPRGDPTLRHKYGHWISPSKTRMGPARVRDLEKGVIFENEPTSPHPSTPIPCKRIHDRVPLTSCIKLYQI